jgi:peptidoglycan/LPS O-acetylase OafA/YrhL
MPLTYTSVAASLGILLYLLSLSSLLSRYVKFYQTNLIDPSHRFTTLDGLRGLLASSVFIHHGVITQAYMATGRWTYPEDSHFISNLGPTAVQVFFMITGLLFWDRVISTKGLIDWKRFFHARLRRLIPMYMVSASLVILIALIETGFKLRVPFLALTKSVLDWCAMGIQGFPDINGLPQTARINAYVFGTLTYEWAFYLALPFLATFSQSRPFVIMLSCLCAYFVFRLGKPQVIWFIVGMLSAVTLRVMPRLAILRSRLFSVVAIIAVSTTLALPRQEMKYFGFVGSSIFFLIVASGNDLAGVLTFAGARLLGLVSYSVYVLHGIVLYVSVKFCNLSTCSPLQFWLFLLGVSTILLIISATTFRWVEFPYLRKPSPSRGAA